MFRDAISPFVVPALGSSKATRTLDLWLLQQGIRVACAPALKTDGRTQIAANPKLDVSSTPYVVEDCFLVAQVGSRRDATV